MSPKHLMEKKVLLPRRSKEKLSILVKSHESVDSLGMVIGSAKVRKTIERDIDVILGKGKWEKKDKKKGKKKIIIR